MYADHPLLILLYLQVFIEKASVFGKQGTAFFPGVESRLTFLQSVMIEFAA